MSFQYLNPKQEYEDRYDLGTIKECLNQLGMIDEVSKKL
jgi:hypothetical protein